MNAPAGRPQAHLRAALSARRSGCWYWPYAKDADGYGVVYSDAGRPGRPRVQLVHRVAYYRTHGRWPTIGRHSCDHPACFNPAHIEDGQVVDNVRDAYDRGRAAHGERGGAAKLRNQDIPTILDRLEAGESCVAIAADYGVHRTQIGRIRAGVTWRRIAEAV